MNTQFNGHIQEMPALFAALLNADRQPMKPRSEWKQKRAIYVIWIDGKAADVGRTRNLQGRVRGHVSNSHYSASFVFKQTRRTLNKSATYTPENSRSALFAQADFHAEFTKHRDILRAAELTFLEVENPVDQYLLELYAAMEFGLELDEFNTH